MKASELVSQSGPIVGQAEAILQAIKQGDYIEPVWVPIQTQSGSKTATFLVSNDGLRIGDSEESVRINLSHRHAQVAADLLEAVLPTPKLSDAIWYYADYQLEPIVQNKWVKDGTMTLTTRMFEQSQIVDQAIAVAGGYPGALVADVGKDWAITKRLFANPRMAINYGWHLHNGWKPAATPEGERVIQPGGMAHNDLYSDYSQIVRLIKRDVQVCDAYSCSQMDIGDMVKDPNYADLVSHEGVLPDIVHPSVSEYEYEYTNGNNWAQPAKTQTEDISELPGNSWGKKAFLIVVGATAGYFLVSQLVD